MELAESFQSVSTHLVLILLSFVLYFVYIYKAKYKYWTYRGVPSQSLLQSFVRTLRLVLRLDSFVENFHGLYKALDGHRYGGTFGLAPKLMLRDPELIQMVLTKVFAKFGDRWPTPDEKLDPFSVTIDNLCGEKWRQVRWKLGPAFSSNRLKMMFQGLEDCVQETDSYLETLLGGTGSVEVEAQNLMYKYSLDVTGLCNLGIKYHFTQNENTEFKRLAADIIRFDFRRMIFNILTLLHPKLPVLVRWNRVRSEVNSFFLAACKESATLKDSKTAAKKAFLHVLLDAQEGEKKNIESQPYVESSENAGVIFADNVIVGTMLSFINVGGRGMSYRLSLLLYELALHPNVQEKIFAEIQEVKRHFGDDVKYETLTEFRYTTQVIDESLRKYPGVPILERMCTEPFNIPDTSLVVEKNVSVIIPVYGLHRDPQYFPDPEKFDPDRFSEENKAKIIPGTYLPFSKGPRGCIANRFVGMIMKLILIQLVSKYTIHSTERTPKAVTFDPQIFGLAAKEKLWIRLQKRT